MLLYQRARRWIYIANFWSTFDSYFWFYKESKGGVYEPGPMFGYKVYEWKFRLLRDSEIAIL